MPTQTPPSPPRPELQFARFLTPDTLTLLAEPQNWAWITSFTPDPVSPLTDPRYDAYLRDDGNMHMPNHRRAMLTLKGSGLYTAHHRIYRRCPGMVMLFDRREASQWASLPKQPNPGKPFTRTLWLHFRQASDSLTYEIRDGNQQLLPMTVKTGPLVANLTQAWDHCTATKGDPMSWLYLKTLLMSCFLEILGTATESREPHRHEQVIHFMQEYIREHHAEPLRLEKLAHLAGYSPSFFHQLFRRYAGVTPQEYLNRVRLQQAEQLLCENYTVEAVSEQIGMSSPAYFRRFFKNRMRMTPGQWRKIATSTK